MVCVPGLLMYVNALCSLTLSSADIRVFLYYSRRAFVGPPGGTYASTPFLIKLQFLNTEMPFTRGAYTYIQQASTVTERTHFRKFCFSRRTATSEAAVKKDGSTVAVMPGIIAFSTGAVVCSCCRLARPVAATSEHPVHSSRHSRRTRMADDSRGERRMVVPELQNFLMIVTEFA